MLLLICICDVFIINTNTKTLAIAKTTNKYLNTCNYRTNANLKLNHITNFNTFSLGRVGNVLEKHMKIDIQYRSWTKNKKIKHLQHVTQTCIKRLPAKFCNTEKLHFFYCGTAIQFQWKGTTDLIDFDKASKPAQISCTNYNVLREF